MADRYWVKRLAEVPRVPDGEPGTLWYPLQHHFGLTAFGANLFVAEEPGGELIGEHDESGSGQEELYVVLAGEAVFEIDGDRTDAPALSVVCVRDASVRRRAEARVAGTTVIAVGGIPRPDFASTWRPTWFERVPRA